MAETNQADEAKVPYRLRSMVGTELPAEPTYPLIEDEFLNLCEGSTSDAKSGMYFCIGLFVSSVVGFFSLFENTDWKRFWAQQERMPLVYFAVLLVIGAAGFVGFIICGSIILKKNKRGNSHSRIKAKITKHFFAGKEITSEPSATSPSSTIRKVNR